MTFYETIDGSGIDLHGLNEQEQDRTLRLAQHVIRTIEHCTRTQLKKFRDEFHVDAHQECDAIGKRGRSVFNAVVRDLKRRIGIAAGLQQPPHDDPNLQAKPWTGREEDPVYAFHVSRKIGAKKDQLEIDSGLIRTFDREDGDYAGQLRSAKPKETHVMVGSFPFADSESAAFVATLQEDYGDAIDDLLTKIFRDAFLFGKKKACEDIINATPVHARAHDLPLVQKLYREVGHDITSLIRQTVDIGIYFGSSGSKKGYI